MYNINYNIMNVIHNRLWNKTRNAISNDTNDEINKHVLINILDIHNKSIEPISFNINEIFWHFITSINTNFFNLLGCFKAI